MLQNCLVSTANGSKIGVNRKNTLNRQRKQKKRKPGAGRPVKYTDIENTLLTWFNEHRSAGKALKYEALRLHKINGNQSFKASRFYFSAHNPRVSACGCYN